MLRAQVKELQQNPPTCLLLTWHRRRHAGRIFQVIRTILVHASSELSIESLSGVRCIILLSCQNGQRSQLQELELRIARAFRLLPHTTALQLLLPATFLSCSGPGPGCFLGHATAGPEPPALRAPKGRCATLE